MTSSNDPGNAGTYILESKHLGRLSREEQLEVITRALAEVTNEGVALCNVLRAEVNHLRTLLETLAKCICKLDAQSIEQAILESIGDGRPR